MSTSPARGRAQSPARGVVRGAYYPSWNYASVNPSKIDFSESHFTHLFYAFVNPDPTTFDLVITSNDKPILSDLVSAAHNRSPPVMVLLSIGGGGVGGAVFSNMSGAEGTRSRFIRSTIEVARENDVDGFDLDWESPKDAAEMVNLGLLFEEWRVAIELESTASGRRRLLLTAAVYFSNHFFLPGKSPCRSYPSSSIAKNLDWINAMCYDYHGSWDTSATGEHAALYDATSNVSTSYGLTSWTSSGVPRQKVVMGLPAYGRSWELKDAAEHGIGAPAVGVGPGADGVLKYTEIKGLEGWTEVYDMGTGSAYAYRGTGWVGYDDRRSVAQKVKYAEVKGLGGYFFWAIGQDLNWTLSRQGMALRVFNSRIINYNT
ncbi:hypothetical protein QJS04_geneDACA003803 [Acorus gramineus]|uniref:GH18 domain-containing protein n=1 Tax=Acorus gramineus TaxID=55184 RepID=A0AAV9BKU1_ACOGR|nr:hypothetical protein QJS04_geneDACA003803 [Acorus gramineus]